MYPRLVLMINIGKKYAEISTKEKGQRKRGVTPILLMARYTMTSFELISFWGVTSKLFLRKSNSIAERMRSTEKDLCIPVQM